MIFAVVILSGAIVSAAFIAGLLTLYQIRQSTNASDSARAFYAADAGLEHAFYQEFKDPTYPAPIMTNGTSVQVTVDPGNLIQSAGQAGSVSRALEARL